MASPLHGIERRAFRLEPLELASRFGRATTPAGKLQMHILGAIAEFERERIRERVLAGLQRARAQGKRLGRPRVLISIERVQQVSALRIDEAARSFGVSRSTVKRWRRQIGQIRPPDGGL